MDKDAGVLQIGSGEFKFHGFSTLAPVQRDPVNEEELQFLWSHIKDQEYAFDDFSKGRVDFFLCQLADINSEFLKIGNHGLFMINHPYEGGTADVHFVVWDKEYSLYRERKVMTELFDWLFFEKKVHRVQGMVPNYNSLGQRFVISCGLRFEGEMRDAVLWGGKYWSVKMFAILKDEYCKRRERLALQ